MGIAHFFVLNFLVLSFSLSAFATQEASTKADCRLEVSDVSVVDGHYSYTNKVSSSLQIDLVDAEEGYFAEFNKSFSGFNFSSTFEQEFGSDLVMVSFLISRNERNSNSYSAVSLKQNVYIPLLELIDGDKRAMLSCLLK